MRGMIVHDCYVMILKIKDMKPQNHNSDKNTPQINRLFLFFWNISAIKRRPDPASQMGELDLHRAVTLGRTSGRVFDHYPF